MTQLYTAYTLVDISASNVVSMTSKDYVGYNQQQNLNTLLQLISLRSQPINMQVQVLQAQDLVNFNFGKLYKGLHTVWKLTFGSEYSNVYEFNNNPVFFLEKDCDGVGFVPDLKETVDFKSYTFETVDVDTINLYFNTIR